MIELDDPASGAVVVGTIVAEEPNDQLFKEVHAVLRKAVGAHGTFRTRVPVAVGHRVALVDKVVSLGNVRAMRSWVEQLTRNEQVSGSGPLAGSLFSHI